MKKYIPLFVIVLVLIIDQWSKIYIKSHWILGQEWKIADWFIIHFTENNGMAYGIEFGGHWGKLALSLFRVIAISLIGVYLYKTIKESQKPMGYLISVALVFAGALGNIFDSAFYGLIFNDSYFQVASFMPDAGGYAGFLHGKVVDMLYFPLFQGQFPDWFPIWGSEQFLFFRPVFNVADSAITVGIALVLLLYRNQLLK
ncbi:MAG: lipoprotein signal peptidase [Bacteroidales bacterium]|nr:lipoprotein signal peptidase [Bacteroidales bacterium]